LKGNLHTSLTAYRTPLTAYRKPHTAFCFLLFCLFLVSCKEKVEEKKMTLVVASSEVKFEVAGAGYLTIDWGDGTKPEQFTLSNYKTEYYHEYQSEEKHSIILNGWVTGFYCKGSFTTNQIISLNAGNNNSLKYLDCSDNVLTNLDISKCTELTELYCNDNQLTNLNLSNNKALIILKCWNNQLSSLDVRKNVALTNMSCSNNKITNLDLSNNTELKELYCNDNQLTNLDVSRNIELAGLYCHNNRLTNFDATHNKKLKGLYVQNNQLSTYPLNALLISLHNNTISGGKSICISGNPGTNFCDRKIAEYKGWSVF
jgi:Leucine-rich repeat (LRR) protein